MEILLVSNEWHQNLSTPELLIMKSQHADYMLPGSYIAKLLSYRWGSRSQMTHQCFSLFSQQVHVPNVPQVWILKREIGQARETQPVLAKFQRRKKCNVFKVSVKCTSRYLNLQRKTDIGWEVIRVSSWGAHQAFQNLSRENDRIIFPGGL